MMQRQVKMKTKHGESPRFGKRHHKTMARTAKALGSNYTPTTPWKQRKQEGDY